MVDVSVYVRAIVESCLESHSLDCRVQTACGNGVCREEAKSSGREEGSGRWIRMVQRRRAWCGLGC
eukprot:127832-Rhodomonas_salina.2